MDRWRPAGRPCTANASVGVDVVCAVRGSEHDDPPRQMSGETGIVV